MNFLDLNTSYQRLAPQLSARFTQIMQSGQWILGPVVEELEGKLAAYTGANFCISCANGTDALYLSLACLPDIKDKFVFTPSFTFAATLEAIIHAGAIPVFVDVDKNTFTLCPIDLERKLIFALSLRDAQERNKNFNSSSPSVNTPSSLSGSNNSDNSFGSQPSFFSASKYLGGVITVNLFGAPADYEKIHFLTNKYRIPLIEDGAQSFGAEWGGQKSGTLGQISCTSFYPTKPLSCFGDGGAIFTSNEHYAQILKQLRNHGQSPQTRYTHNLVGINSRLDSLQAGFLLEKLKIFQGEMRARQNVALRYLDAFSKYPQIRPQTLVPQSNSAWAHFSLLVPDRDGLAQTFVTHKIPYQIYYPKPLHLQPAFISLGYREGSLPTSEYLCKNIISLPMHPYLSWADQNLVIQVVIEHCRKFLS